MIKIVIFFQILLNFSNLLLYFYLYYLYIYFFYYTTFTGYGKTMFTDGFSFRVPTSTTARIKDSLSSFIFNGFFISNFGSKSMGMSVMEKFFLLFLCIIRGKDIITVNIYRVVDFSGFFLISFFFIFSDGLLRICCSGRGYLILRHIIITNFFFFLIFCRSN